MNNTNQSVTTEDVVHFINQFDKNLCQCEHCVRFRVYIERIKDANTLHKDIKTN